jgi:hypothetical protein
MWKQDYDGLVEIIKKHNEQAESAPTLSEPPKSVQEGLRFLADWFDAVYQDAGVNDDVQQRLRKWANLFNELIAENERLKAQIKQAQAMYPFLRDDEMGGGE